MNKAGLTSLAAALFLCGLFAVPSAPAQARATVVIRQKDGKSTTYTNVLVRIKNQAMALVSADGQGRFVLGKAACTLVGALLRCFAYDATLEQYGQSRHIPLKNGTVWFNPTTTAQNMPNSSNKIKPHGVVLSFLTEKDTFVSGSGTVDELSK